MEQINIQEASKQIFQYLEDQRKQNPKFTYALRKDNYNGYLETGYWFYGGEDFLAISFWSGMDWKNQMPNISWILDSMTGTSLEINISDSDEKIPFVENELEQLYLTRDNKHKYYKEYLFTENINDESIINSLEHFILNDKKIIDNALNGPYSNESKINDIGFINQEEFTKRHEKVEYYREQLEKFKRGEKAYSNRFGLPGKIESFRISNYSQVKDIQIEFEQERNNWIFMTGENGSGKTEFLRGLATLIGNREVSKRNKNYTGFIKLENSSQTGRFRNDIGINEKPNRPHVSALAVYGPYRLSLTGSRLTSVQFNKKIIGENQLDSLFKPSVKLLSLDKQLLLWQRGSRKDREFLDKRLYYIKFILTELFEDLVDIEFKHKRNSVDLLYYFRHKGSDSTYSRKWNQLSSGNKSMLGMIGDILIRFYYHLPKVEDPSEFRGVVIIDEIDLHLHPKAQKELVTRLSKIFINIQFIVSTHSPIPMLGAPKESSFYRVKNHEGHIEVDQLDIDVSKLLPNTILSSPIFGMSNLLPDSNKSHKEIRTEKNWRELKFNDRVNSELKEIYKRLKNNEGN